jgi:hypothetical protein
LINDIYFSAIYSLVRSQLTYIFMTLCVELRLAFSMFDKDGDGQISAQEVRETMESLGIHVEPSQVKMMVKKVDTDGKYSCACALNSIKAHRWLSNDVSMCLTAWMYNRLILLIMVLVLAEYNMTFIGFFVNF